MTQDAEKLDNLQRLQAAQERRSTGKSFDEFTITGSKTSETLGNHNGSKHTGGAISPIPGIGFNPAQQGQQNADLLIAHGEKNGDQPASVSTVAGTIQQQQARLYDYSAAVLLPPQALVMPRRPINPRPSPAQRMAPRAGVRQLPLLLPLILFAAAPTGTPAPLIKNPTSDKPANALGLRFDAGGQKLRVLAT